MFSKPHSRALSTSPYHFTQPIRILLWLSLAHSVLGIEEARAVSSPVMRTLSKRSSSSKTVYIGVLVGVLGSAVIISAGVCWDLHRRRRLSKLRQMEEARHPRQPISYDHFPTDEDESGPMAGNQMSDSRNGNLSTMSMASNAAAVSVPRSTDGRGRGPITVPQPVYSPAHRDQPSTQNALGVTSSTRSSWVEDEVDTRQAEEEPLADRIPLYSELEAPAIESPPFTQDIRRILPPGLERHTDSSPSVPGSGTDTPNTHPQMPLTPPPSRPPTASAPPAYTPSNADTSGNNSNANLPTTQHALPSSQNPSS